MFNESKDYEILGTIGAVVEISVGCRQKADWISQKSRQAIVKNGKNANRLLHKIVKYRKIPNISPGLIEVRKHFLGGLYSGGAYIRGRLIFGGHFVLVIGGLIFGVFVFGP